MVDLKDTSFESLKEDLSSFGRMRSAMLQLYERPGHGTTRQGLQCFVGQFGIVLVISIYHVVFLAKSRATLTVRTLKP